MAKRLFILFFIAWIPVLSFMAGVMVTVGFGTRYIQHFNKSQSFPYSPEPLPGIVEGLSKREAVIGDELIIAGKDFGEEVGAVDLYGKLSTSPYFSRLAKAEILSWKDQEIWVRIPRVPETDLKYDLSVLKPASRGNYHEVVSWAGGVNNEIWILPNVYEYLVQSGDSLMSIAQKELGGEGRYLEIISLNKKLYPDLNAATALGVGMKLRLPKD